MAPTAGWYDDPRDDGRLRYWDGEAWTDHVTAKNAAGGSPAIPLFPGADQAQQQTWNYGQPTQPATQQGQAPPQQGPSAPYPQQPHPQQPYPQYPQAPYPQQQPGSYPGYPGWQQPSAHPPGTVLTPDGAVVTSWVKRFAAALLDLLFVCLGTAPATGYFFYRAVDAQTKAMDAGTYHPFSITSEVRNWEVIAGAIIVVGHLLYVVFSLRRWGATPGHRVLGISVRRWDRGGLLAWSTIARRVVLIYGLWLASSIPIVGLLATIAAVVNYLWPLWDSKNQALHDKLADTVVIEGARRESP